jgi:DNA polymerase-1
MKRKYLLVDLSNFIFRFATSKKSAESIAEDVFNNISSFRDSLACTDVIIFVDKKGSDYRKNLYPEYKGNRKKEGKFYEDLKQFFKKLPTIIKFLNIYFPVLSYTGIEADDLIWYVSQKYKCVILSTDADLLQCGVPQFSYTKKKYITLEDQWADTPRQFITAKALAGDNSDNIKGLERVGLKTALKYLKKYDVDNFQDLADSINPKTKSKIEQRILNGKEIYERNIRLVDLELVNEEIVTPELEREIEEIINEYKDEESD